MQKKRKYTNRLNDLAPKEWLKFQKSWFVHNPPRRLKNVLRHPAKFPETLAQAFIEFFTRRGQGWRVEGDRLVDESALVSTGNLWVEQTIATQKVLTRLWSRPSKP